MRVEDILILQNALWKTVDQKEKVQNIVRYHAQDVVEASLENIQKEAEEILKKLLMDNSTDAGLEETQKVKSLVSELNKLKKDNANRINDTDPVLKEIMNYQQQVLNSILEPMGTLETK